MILIYINIEKNTVSKISDGTHEKTLENLKPKIKERGYQFKQVLDNRLMVLKSGSMIGFYLKCSHDVFTKYKNCEAFLNELENSTFPIRLDEFRDLRNQLLCQDQKCKEFFNVAKRDIFQNRFWVVNPYLRGGDPFGFDTIAEFYNYRYNIKP